MKLNCFVGFFVYFIDCGSETVSQSVDGRAKQVLSSMKYNELGQLINKKLNGFIDGETASTEYLYDDNGNMTKDLNKGISDIQYNVLNLPEQIRINGVEGG